VHAAARPFACLEHGDIVTSLDQDMRRTETGEAGAKYDN
jgi:hypothetical protein